VTPEPHDPGAALAIALFLLVVFALVLIAVKWMGDEIHWRDK
jgi:Tfp pilus assembly protein PilX